jgi:uncharacterized protein with FMN-binding domain
MKKIGLSLFVIAASAAYVLAQTGDGKSNDVLGSTLPSDDVPTGSIAAQAAEAVPSRSASAALPVPAVAPPAVPPSAPPAEDETAIPAAPALASEDEDEAASPPPQARAFNPPPASGKLAAAADLAAAAPAPVAPSPSEPPPAPLPSTPPSAAPVDAPALAMAEIPLPRPRPAYHLTRAGVTRAVATPVAATPAVVVAAARSGYADGTYTGPTVDAYYGLVQVQAVVQGGRLVNIQVLRYPSDRRTSVYINRHALPLLRDEVIRAQSAHVDIVSGATLTSRAFMRSLDAALRQANA